MSDEGPIATGGIWSKSVVIVAAQSTQAISLAAIALFLPLIRSDLDISFGQVGLLAAVPMLMYALMQLPVGFLTDRLSSKYLFAGGVLITNALGIVFAIVDSFAWLLVVQGAAGVSRAFMFIPGLLLITKQFSEERRASAMGLLFAGGLSAYVTVNLLGPVLVDPLGWRGFLIFTSGVGIALVVAFWLISPDAASARHERGLGGSQRWVWKTSAWWVIGFIQFARMAIMAGFTFWLPAYLVVERGLPLIQAGLVVALTYALAAVFNLAGSAISDRTASPLRLIGISLVALALLLAAIGYVREPIMLVVLICVVGVFIQFYFGPLFIVPRVLFGRGADGISAGFGNFCANLGGFGASFSLGLVRDATDSFAAGFLCLAGVALASLLATALLSRLTPTPPISTP